jgi:hypothetical protein
MTGILIIAVTLGVVFGLLAGLIMILILIIKYDDKQRNKPNP